MLYEVITKKSMVTIELKNISSLDAKLQDADAYVLAYSRAAYIIV